jgi:hypothetical protein
MFNNIEKFKKKAKEVDNSWSLNKLERQKKKKMKAIKKGRV